MRLAAYAYQEAAYAYQEATCFQQVAGWDPPAAVLADSAVTPKLGAGPHSSLQPDSSVLLAVAGAGLNFQLETCGTATWCGAVGFCRPLSFRLDVQCHVVSELISSGKQYLRQYGDCQICCDNATAGCTKAAAGGCCWLLPPAARTWRHSRRGAGCGVPTALHHSWQIGSKGCRPLRSGQVTEKFDGLSLQKRSSLRLGRCLMLMITKRRLFDTKYHQEPAYFIENDPQMPHAGQTAFLPSGWLAAHLALTDGAAVCGRWLQRGALAPQIAAWQLSVTRSCLFCQL